jgi:hypothetical protein
MWVEIEGTTDVKDVKPLALIVQQSGKVSVVRI